MAYCMFFSTKIISEIKLAGLTKLIVLLLCAVSCVGCQLWEIRPLCCDGSSTLDTAKLCTAWNIKFDIHVCFTVCMYFLICVLGSIRLLVHIFLNTENIDIVYDKITLKLEWNVLSSSPCKFVFVHLGFLSNTLDYLLHVVELLAKPYWFDQWWGLGIMASTVDLHMGISNPYWGAFDSICLIG